MITYDDSRLTAFFAKLDPKQRRAALKGGIRRCANKVKRQAVSNLRTATNPRGKKLNASTGLDKGIRTVVYKKKAAGFRVTIGTKINKNNPNKTQGYHRNRAWRKAKAEGKSEGALRSMEKPVLLWAELGTRGRKTKSKTRVFVRKKKGHSTGKMPAYLFMKKTKEQMKDRITEEIRTGIREYMTKTMKKHGK